MVAMAFTIIRMVCGYYVVANGTPYCKTLARHYPPRLFERHNPTKI